MKEHQHQKGLEQRFHFAKEAIIQAMQANGRGFITLGQGKDSEIRMDSQGNCASFERGMLAHEIVDLRGLVTHHARIYDPVLSGLHGHREHSHASVVDYVTGNYQALADHFVEHVESLAWQFRQI